MAAAGLISRSNLVGTGRAISVIFGINGVRNKRSHFVGPPFLAFKVHFSAKAGCHFSRGLSRCLLFGGCGQSHISVKGWLKLPLRTVLSLTTNRTETGVHLRVLESENDLEKKTWTLKR